MRNKRENVYEWTLAIVRDGRQGIVKNTDEAEFKFGRWRRELNKSINRHIPNGLISLLRHQELEEIALESGFLVRMSSKSKRNKQWIPFKKVVMVEKWEIGPPKTIYSEPSGLYSLEMEVICCNDPPDTLWITVEELPESILAWIFGKGLLLNYEGKQSTLHEWCEFPDGMIPEKSAPLALPGPPDFRYHFFGD